MNHWTNLTRVAPATTPLLDLDLTKTYIHASDDDDDVVAGLIEAATAFIESPDGIGVSLIASQWRASFDTLPSSLPLALTPVMSVDQVTVLTDAGVVEIDPETIHLANAQTPAMVCFLGDRPTPKRLPGSVTVTFTAGYGDDPSSVPADLRHAALWLVAAWFENRGDDASKAMIPATVERVLNKYRRF